MLIRDLIISCVLTPLRRGITLNCMHSDAYFSELVNGGDTSDLSGETIFLERGQKQKMNA
jgi:hypothetical protein